MPASSSPLSLTVPDARRPLGLPVSASASDARTLLRLQGESAPRRRARSVLALIQQLRIDAFGVRSTRLHRCTPSEAPLDVSDVDSAVALRSTTAHSRRGQSRYTSSTSRLCLRRYAHRHRRLTASAVSDRASLKSACHSLAIGYSLRRHRLAPPALRAPFAAKEPR